MSSDLFREGGPHKIRKTGSDQHTFSISIPKDADGRIARECPDKNCSPGMFKVTPGTRVTDGQEIVFCPYCRGEAEPSDYTTQEQIRYAKDIAMSEAHDGINRMLKKSLGLDSRGKRSFGGDLLKIDMELKQSRKPPVRRPYADLLRRDVLCPACGLDHSVYVLATWCSDCGQDIFTTHVLGEIGVVHTILSDVPRREDAFGVRIAASDIENALEDLVSIFEATLKYEIRRYATGNGVSRDEVDKQMGRLGSRLQSVRNAIEILPKQCGIGFDGTPNDELDRLDRLFQKRHPITHNLGVIDRKYLERMQTGEPEGREVRVTLRDVSNAATAVFGVLERFHTRLYPNTVKAQQSDGPNKDSAIVPSS